MSGGILGEARTSYVLQVRLCPECSYQVYEDMGGAPEIHRWFKISFSIVLHSFVYPFLWAIMLKPTFTSNRAYVNFVYNEAISGSGFEVHISEIHRHVMLVTIETATQRMFFQSSRGFLKRRRPNVNIQDLKMRKYDNKKSDLLQENPRSNVRCVVKISDRTNCWSRSTRIRPHELRAPNVWTNI